MTFGVVASSGPLAAGGYTAAVLADSPLFYWRLGESSGSSAADASGNARHGTYNGSITYGVAGAISDGDTAVSNFTTAGVSVAIADAAWMDVLSGGISVECWVNFTNNLSTAEYAVGRDNDSGATSGRHWAVRLGSSEQANLLLWNATTFTSVSGSTTGLNDGNWHHIVCTYDGSDVRVYVDGSLDGGPTSFSGGLVAKAQNIRVGVAEGGARTFSGAVDEVAYYDTALSAARVLAHYNAA